MKKVFLRFFPFSGLFYSEAVSPIETRLLRVRVLGVCLALLALGVYCWTLSPVVVPGASALAGLSSLHVGLGRELVGHPLWSIASHLFSTLPLGELPYRLNLFSALCGAGAVYFLFRLVSLALYDVMSEDCWRAQMEDAFWKDALSEEDARTGGQDRINNRGHLIAMGGGAVSALAFAFSTPFWLASTSVHFQTFEILLLLAAGYALMGYWAKSYMPCAVMAAFLLGLGVVESVYFLVVLPLALLGLLVGGSRHGHISVFFVGVLVLSFVVGALLAGAAQVGWLLHAGCFNHDLVRIATLWRESHADGLRAMIACKGGLLMLVQGLLPLLIVYSGRYYFVNTHLLNPSMDDTQEYADQNSEEHKVRLSGWFWWMTFFIFFGCAAYALLNLPGSPWSFSRESDYLPVIPLLGIAMTFGCVFSFVVLCGYGPQPGHAKGKNHAAPRNAPRLPRIMSAGMMILACTLIAATVIRNKGEIEGQKALFVDLLCREILEAAPDAHCFVTDGTFDMSLSMQARLLKREVVFLNIRTADATRHPLAEFLVGWLAEHPEGASQVALLTAPELWYEAGFQALPGPLVYGGAPPDAKLNLKSLLNDQRIFWKKNKHLFAEGAPRSILLRNLQKEMKAQASRTANDLGVLCLHNNAREEARDAFSLALDMDPDNLCAWLNQCAPEAVDAQKKTGESSLMLLESVSARMQAPSSFDSLRDRERRYGALYLPAVEHLANLCNTLPDSEYPEKRSTVMQQTQAYVRAAILANAEPSVAQQPSLKDTAIDEDMINIVEVITEGYSKAAENQLRNLLRIRRASLVAWSLLAEVLMTQGNSAEVQSTVLPEMRLIAGTKGSEWLDLTEGCLALLQATPDYRAAHEQFARVLQRKPELQEAQNLLIQTALALGDQALIEADCKAVMEHSPRHPLANIALGVLRLNQNRLEDAEKALSVSIASQPSSLAFNNLGETLRRMQRLQAAEGVTRRALLLQPECFQAWDTLALILKDQGRLEEAAEAHSRGLRLCQADTKDKVNDLLKNLPQ